MFAGVSTSLPSTIGSSCSYRVYNIDDEASEDCRIELPQSSNQQHRLSSSEPDPTECTSSPLQYFSQASASHNRRMIIPYSAKRNSAKRRVSGCLDEPLVFYRFFEFYCSTCDQLWLSPLFRAKDGCFCRICHHFILPRGIRHSFTPYLGTETCYGKYSCHVCGRGWSSYKSLSNCPDQCFQCASLVYPYYQIAHSVLSQKIHRNADATTKSAFLKNILLTERHHQRISQNLPNGNDPRSHSANIERQECCGQVHDLQQEARHQLLQQQPRKIISISGILTSTKQTLINKKRLHCLNNVPFLQHKNKQIRRQMHLKPCFSEPIIST